MDPKKRFYIEDKKQIAKRSYFSIWCYQIKHELFRTGLWQSMTRWLIKRPAAVVVVPYDPVLDAVLLIQQFRVGAMASEHSPWQWEWVAGMADRTETLETLARRELMEEAGIEAKVLYQVHTYWVSPGYTDERIHLFCAIVDLSDAGGIYGVTEESEDICATVLPRKTLDQWLKTGRLDNGSLLLGTYWLMQHYQQLCA